MSQEDLGFMLFPYILRESCHIDVTGCTVVWPRWRTQCVVAGDFTVVISVSRVLALSHLIIWHCWRGEEKIGDTMVFKSTEILIIASVAP